MLLVENTHVEVLRECLIPSNPSPELSQIAISREIQELSQGLTARHKNQNITIFYDQETISAKSAYGNISKRYRMLKPGIISSGLQVASGAARLHFKNWLLDPLMVDIQGNSIGECLAIRARSLLKVTHSSSVAESLAMIELYIAVLRETLASQKVPEPLMTDQWLWI